MEKLIQSVLILQVSAEKGLALMKARKADLQFSVFLAGIKRS